jgi:hypothetical protein
MDRNLVRGAFWAAIDYFLFVWVGTALCTSLFIAPGGPWYFDAYGNINPSFRAVFISVAIYMEQVLGVGLGLIWFLPGVFLYLCALSHNKLHAGRAASKLVLIMLSMFASAVISRVLPPVALRGFAGLFITIFVAAPLGAFFVFFLTWRVRKESYRRSRLDWGYRAIAAALLFILCSTYAQIAYAAYISHVVHDPPLDFVFVKWTPAEGEVREEPNGKFDSTFPGLKDSEIQELRAAGVTGVLTVHGGQTTFVGPKRSRVVLIMSRGIGETIDLPKPASGDIIYLQTEEGWKRFPPSTPVLSRTIRLTFSRRSPRHFDPGTSITVDRGLGHPSEGSDMTVFNWGPFEFASPLPSPSDRRRGQASSP